MLNLGPQSAHIFRITHIDNVPWILEHGLYSKNSPCQDPNFVSIGLQELIGKRPTRQVDCEPWGALGDYVPFYFTPASIMLYNIATGYGSVTQRPNREIVVIVSSIPRLIERELRYVFTTSHAYQHGAEFYEDPADLVKIDWKILCARDFKTDPEDPGKKGRYQAEALVHSHVPTDAILGMACYNTSAQQVLEAEVARRQLTLPIKVQTSWYF